MEMRRVLTTTLIAALALSVAALLVSLTTCGGVAPTEEVTKPTLLPIDKGTPEPIHEGTVAIEMRVGDTHTVALESNPTTGYQWVLGSDYDERLLELIQQNFEPDSDLIGAPGRELFTFRALASGIVEFSFNYKRSWEDRVLKTGRYTFVIGVREALAGEMSEAEAREIAANSASHPLVAFLTNCGATLSFSCPAV